MDVRDFLRRLERVQGSGNGWEARCPAHDDHDPSLSVAVGDDGRILANCHKGCPTEKIVAAMGLTMRDLFPDKQGDKPKKERYQIETIYQYPNGAQKIRYADKSFGWRRPDGKDGWIWNRQGVHRSLYTAGPLGNAVFVCEGEKDADSVFTLGYSAVSGEDGAGPGKWRKEYTKQLKGRSACIFQDNDDVGKAYAQETAAALYGVCTPVKVLDLSIVWPEIPEHGDVSDLIATFGPDKSKELIAVLVVSTPDWTPPPPEADPFLACFKSLDSIEEQEARWLIPWWMPEGQIVLLASDGGIGKTTFWVYIIACLSSGKRCILDPEEYSRHPQRVAFLTTEDSVRKKLKKKLRLAGADMKNIITPDFSADKEGLLRNLKFGSVEIEKFIRYYRPALCVFDPVQGFVPPDINMGSRNAMRDCMAPLITLGEETGTTFLVVCHTNKRKGAYGRDRIADSADLWDVARSVLMAGYTENQGVRYLSNEKNNYAALQDTLLFSIDGNGQVNAEGTSWKRDREYVQENAFAVSAPKREDCKGWILHELEQAGNTMTVKALDEKAIGAGYSSATLRRAKEDLSNAGEIVIDQSGGTKNKLWYIQKTDFEVLPDDTPTPWTS